MSKAGFGQFICVVLLGVFIFFSFFGKGESDTKKTVEEIAEVVTEQISTKNLESFGEERLNKNFGLDGEDFDSFIYYGSEDIMDVREILIIKGKENSDLENTADIIGKKAEEKYNTYKDYDPLASSLLKNRVIQISGGVIIYIVDENAPAGLEAFLKCVED